MLNRVYPFAGHKRNRGDRDAVCIPSDFKIPLPCVLGVEESYKGGMRVRWFDGIECFVHDRDDAVSIKTSEAAKACAEWATLYAGYTRLFFEPLE